MTCDLSEGHGREAVVTGVVFRFTAPLQKEIEEQLQEQDLITEMIFSVLHHLAHVVTLAKGIGKILQRRQPSPNIVLGLDRRAKCFTKIKLTLSCNAGNICHKYEVFVKKARNIYLKCLIHFCYKQGHCQCRDKDLNVFGGSLQGTDVMGESEKKPQAKNCNVV
ncbi:hypothetical protein BTVI_88665 [Pitangus sulphuratus]|nr:hypothetical protein BTVI_88665 [Pitangus sulphuratus]